MNGSRTHLVLIDNQVPQPLGHHRGNGRPVGIPTPISAFGALCPVRLDDRPKNWYGYEESNPNLNVRSVLSCPLDDTRVQKLSAFSCQLSAKQGRAADG